MSQEESRGTTDGIYLHHLRDLVLHEPGFRCGVGDTFLQDQISEQKTWSKF